MLPYTGSDMAMPYCSKVLVKNWYEDRFQEDVASTSSGGGAATARGRTLKDMATADRVLPRDFPLGHPGDFQTTKQLAETSMQTSPPPAKVNKPSMYPDAAIPDRLATYGVPASIHYTLGRNALAEAAQPVERHAETTNQAFFDRVPKEATTRRPEHFRTDRTFAKTAVLTREARQEASRTDDPSLGGKGARGELTRRPGEAGNVYGVSVFVDEYAKWGTALKGVPLGETVSKMQTKYF